jgi:L-fuculose-phosphate aldolase
MESIPELITYIGRRMFERRLTDMAGGNISAYQDGLVYLTPRYSAAHKHWQLDPSDILSAKLDSKELLEDPRLSREGRMHLAIYQNFPEARAVIHAHSYNIQPFVAACKPIQPVLEATQKLGVIELVEAAPSHTDRLAQNVVAGLRGKEESIRSRAAAVLIPYHGVVVVGTDLLTTLDILERIDWNAWCIIAGRMLAG